MEKVSDEIWGEINHKLGGSEDEEEWYDFKWK
jgi:hypothetical protein